MSHMKGKDWAKLAALGALGATGAGLAGVGPMAGLLGGGAAAAGTGAGAAGAAGAGSALAGASGATELAGATGAGLAATPSVVLHPFEAAVGGLKDSAAGLLGGYSNYNKVAGGLGKLGKASQAMKVAGLLQPQQPQDSGWRPPGFMAGTPPTNTTVPGMAAMQQGVGAPVGLDPNDPRVRALLAMQGMGGGYA